LSPDNIEISPLNKGAFLCPKIAGMMQERGQGQQPREKLLLTGPQELSAVELITVLLESGV
jgi:hypothetical protein